MNIRRFITFGDSFVDTGSFYNTTQRSIGFGIPAARSYQGRFSDGPNFMDHLESIVQPEIPSSAFSQPSRLTIEKGSNDLETEVSFIIPSKLTLTNESRFGFVFLDFEQEGFCWSYPDRKVDRKRKINACSGGLKIGQTVTVDKVLLTAPFTRGEVKTDLFFYQVP